jgi:hypothetical protein
LIERWSIAVQALRAVPSVQAPFQEIPLTHRVLAAAFALTCLSLPAMAQTTPAPASPTPGTAMPAVIENGKTLTGVVVSVGGFLGLGESYVVLDPSSLAISNKDGKWMVHADTDKDTLKNAPKFEYSKKKM